MVSRPNQFDVMLLPNLYGNIIANIATGIVGGPGIVSGANMGTDYAVFELVRNYNITYTKLIDIDTFPRYVMCCTHQRLYVNPRNLF